MSTLILWVNKILMYIFQERARGICYKIATGKGTEKRIRRKGEYI